MEFRKVLVITDSFKGTLGSAEAARIAAGCFAEQMPGCRVTGLPVADGGEGTVDAVIAVTKGNIRKVKVHGPLMEETESSYGEFNVDSAIIEMAAASGLPMVPM